MHAHSPPFPSTLDRWAWTPYPQAHHSNGYHAPGQRMRCAPAVVSAVSPHGMGCVLTLAFLFCSFPCLFSSLLLVFLQWQVWPGDARWHDRLFGKIDR